ncbi:hypothetical protein ACH5RR_024110 [Cinchona calisaya]|uniref:Uncharacterized protein n=1 Tax=Cinchona calisaya TaxID=153742 RepID=A0ABD2ZDP3_9GENT
MAWYGSELLGIAVSFVRSPKKIPQDKPELVVYESGLIDRNTIATTIQDDFQRSYFVTDPASSFRGLRHFKRNCTNFGSLLEKSNMKLMKWEEFEDKAIGHWRFSCTLSFPWKPILSSMWSTGMSQNGFTEANSEA